jgi:hypothetical protein
VPELRRVAAALLALPLLVTVPAASAIAVPSGPTMSPQGSWVGTYGSQGYVLGAWNSGTSDLSVLPTGVSFAVDQGSRHCWSCSTTDVRALQDPVNASQRRAATWYDGTRLRAHLTFTGGYSGNLRLYALDWDTTGRRQKITVNDGSGALVVDLTTAFNQGAWTMFPIVVGAGGGTVNITIDRTAGLNAVLSGIFLGDGDPATPPRGEENLEWNICGGASQCPYDDTQEPAVQLANYTISFGSRAAQAQEICTVQWNYLGHNLSSRGYKYARYKSNPTGCADGGGHGNAVFWLGSCPNSGPCSASGAFNNQFNTSPEFSGNLEADAQRGWVCGFDGSLGSCSTHMTHRHDAVAFRQSEEYRSVLDLLGSGRYGAGDFNLTPAQLGNWGTYREADLAFGSADATASQGKLDYAFYHRSSYCLLREADEISDTRSDHKVLVSHNALNC